MKIALIGDTHFGCRHDSEVFYKQHRKFFCEVFFPKLNSEGITKIIHLGDLFDYERTVNTRTVSEMNDMFINVLGRSGMEMWIIPGNHDSYYKEKLDVNTVKETLSHREFVHVMNEPELVEIANLAFVFLPTARSCEVPIDLPAGDILCTHLPMLGFEMYKGIPNLNSTIDASAFNAFSLVLSGDYHHPSSKGNVHYIGAPIEMKWNDFGGPRGFQILDTENLTLEYVKNPNRAFRKIVYDDSDKTLEDMLRPDFSIFKNICLRVTVRACKDRYILNQFVKKIEEQNPFEVTVVEQGEDAFDLDKPLDHTQDTLTMINEFIDGIDVTIDKDQLKSYINEIYWEAEKVSALSQTI